MCVQGGRSGSVCLLVHPHPLPSYLALVSGHTRVVIILIFAHTKSSNHASVSFYRSSRASGNERARGTTRSHPRTLRWRLQIPFRRFVDRGTDCLGAVPTQTRPQHSSHLLGRLLPGLHRQDKHMHIWNSNEFTDVHAATDWKRS